MKVDHAKVREAISRSVSGLNAAERLVLAQEVMGSVLAEIEVSPSQEPQLRIAQGLIEGAAQGLDSGVDLLEMCEVEIDVG